MKIAITGGSRGIGRATVELFAANAADIAVVARTESDLTQMAQDLKAKHPDLNLIFCAADLSTKVGNLQFAELIQKEWGALDVLVNNAGLYLQSDILTEPEENLERQLALNLKSPYHLSRALLPLLLHSPKGHILNICSTASLQAYPNCGAYVVSKFALLGLTKALRLELKDKGVKVSAVIPGATLTSSWDAEEVVEKRLITPEDIARAIWDVYQMGPNSTVEEIIIRPQLGDL